MIILPSTGRPDRLWDTVDSYRRYTVGAYKGVIVIEQPEDIDKNMELPPFWEVITNPTCGGRVVQIFNWVLNEWPDSEFYQILADDVIIETQGWDELLEKARADIAFGDDGIDRWDSHGVARLPTHPRIAGDVAREWGFVAPPVLKHFCADEFWKDMGAVFVPEVKMPHHTVVNGVGHRDGTYKNRPSSAIDKESYERFKNSGVYANLLAV